MLKITQHRDPATKSVSFILEGRLRGPWVDELDICWRRMGSNKPSGSMVDLTAVTFVDEKGKALLTRMWEGGAEFRAAGCLTRCLVEEITKAGRTDSFRVGREGK